MMDLIALIVATLLLAGALLGLLLTSLVMASGTLTRQKEENTGMTSREMIDLTTKGPETPATTNRSGRPVKTPTAKAAGEAEAKAKETRNE